LINILCFGVSPVLLGMARPPSRHGGERDHRALSTTPGITGKYRHPVSGRNHRASGLFQTEAASSDRAGSAEKVSSGVITSKIGMSPICYQTANGQGQGYLRQALPYDIVAHLVMRIAYPTPPGEHQANSVCYEIMSPVDQPTK
jgi:hypothetical protein